MQSTWTPPLRWVFAAATVLGLFSTLQSYRLSTLNLRYPMDIEVGKMLLLNLVYWYVPALADADHLPARTSLPVDGPHWIRALGVHAFAAVSYSVIHCACMIGMRLLLWDSGEQAADRALDVVRAAPVPRRISTSR